MVPNSPSEKPLWISIVRFFISFLLLLLLIWYWSYVVNIMNAGSEGRTEEVEESVGLLRKEMMSKFDEICVRYETEVKKLSCKTDKLGKSLDELKVGEFLMKENFDGFLDDFKKSLNDIRDFVDSEIQKHAADGIGMVDYAGASVGGKVLDHSEPFQFSKQLQDIKQLQVSNIEDASDYSESEEDSQDDNECGGVYQEPQILLEPSFGEPGKCFALDGSKGYVVIMLSRAIVPVAVSLENVAKSVALDRSSAPNNCWVSGWYQTGAEDVLGGKFRFLEFVYDLDRSSVQTFRVDSGEKRIINVVRFDFDSNHGAPYTCIYRLRIHGYEPRSFALTPI